ncbi:ATP-binding cassette domain-containing protein [Clostridium sp. ATCC 25772]|uniref:ATP-binding cassette domain-containing protein n=1 Tax=Clostridium sp. ATCC 25772 TaxID=1676991 RepID=UPI0009EAE0AD|nr:ATP-binding cassette domain-containing protein [Clostridium sp. ATCC 25772]
MEALLKLEKVSYNYDKEKEIIKKLNVSFEKGKFYTIIAPSRLRKTTFLSLVSRLDKQDEGKSFYKEIDTIKILLKNFRNKYVSIVFYGYNLLNYRMALQNTKMGIYIRKLKLKNKSQECLSILAKVGISEKEANQKVLTLSGNQQQRVAIARALVSKTDLIKADEQTGILDEVTSNEIVRKSDSTYKLFNKNLVKI